MRDLVIGDVHFGIKNNSVTWLEYQMKLFKNQIIPAIRDKNIDRVIFLGDLFDIRYSVNQQVGIEVKRLITNMLNEFKDKQFVFIAGNHDYYSPLEEICDYNAYALVFGNEFVKCHQNAKFVVKDPWLDNETLFLPWYMTENPEHFDSLLYNYKFGIEVKSIFCHTDLSIWPGPRITALRGCPVYSGHIHNIISDVENKLYNLGSACAFTYADADETKYLYVIENHEVVEKIANVTTPMFKRIWNEDIFTITEDDCKDAFIQLCISEANLNKAQYIDQIKMLKTTYVDSNIRVKPIDDVEHKHVFSAEGFNTNISQYIEDNMPEHLNNKYELIKDRLKEKQ